MSNNLEVCSILRDIFPDISESFLLDNYSKFLSLPQDQAIELISVEQSKNNRIPDISKKCFLEKFPEFEQLIDKDDLVLLNDDFYILPNCTLQWICYKGYFIYFNDLFPIHWSSESLEAIFEIYYKYHRNHKELFFRVSLNLDRIISLEKYRWELYLGATFYGPDYRADLFFSNLQWTLFSRKQRLNKLFNELFGNDIVYTDFYINSSDGSFQIEEITMDSYDDYFLYRLIHAKFNSEEKQVGHFDWSILFYDEESAYLRQNSKLCNYPKLSLRKEKLFRLDGNLALHHFIWLVLFFYKWNEMILEYFDKDKYRDLYKNILDFENGVDY